MSFPKVVQKAVEKGQEFPVCLNDYVVIMKAILKRYNLTGRTYNDMLRTSKQNRNKTLRDFIIRSLCYFEH